ncbi:hypothetical protein QE152_g32046 [Popillia japonica]|uniref:Uncharacterized protein n=1 Tax=Popillia japonica TaxID=7064 RepID=A0AAW1J106_POPJA
MTLSTAAMDAISAAHIPVESVICGVESSIQDLTEPSFVAVLLDGVSYAGQPLIPEVNIPIRIGSSFVTRAVLEPVRQQKDQ